jgi:D-alanyl-D-alanine carboxypeptidase
MPLSRTLASVALMSLTACGPAPEKPAPAPTPTPQTLSQALDGARIETGAPGVAAAIIDDGRLVFDGVTGDFSRSPGRPLDHDSLFVLQGVTELATVSMAFRLIEQGRIRLEDRLDRYLPYVVNADRITVAMVMDHRTGLLEYSQPGTLYYPLHDPNHSWTREEVLRAIEERNEPGSAQFYSASNNVVLGGILERATRRSIADLFEELVARPAGLESCAFAYDPELEHEVVHGFAADKDQLFDTFPESGRVPTWLWGSVWTDHGLACNAVDTARLADALFGGRLVGPESLTRMTTFSGIVSYSFGVGNRTDRGFPLYGHAGLGLGYSTVAWYDPARRLTIAALANLDTGGIPNTLYDRMEEAYARGATP